MKFSALLAIIAGLTLSTGMPVQAQQKKSAKTVKVSKKKAKKASSKKEKKAAKKKVTIKSHPFVAPVLLNPYSAKMPISAERKAKAIAELERRRIKPEAYVSKLMELMEKNHMSNRDYDVVGLLVSAGVDVSSLQIDNIIDNISVEKVKMLVQSPSFDVNRTEVGKSMLKKAIKGSSMEMLQVLLAQPGVKVDDETLLPAAIAVGWNRAAGWKIAAGWKEGANLLLSLPDVNVSKVPPVMLAVMKNDIKTLKKILKEGGADANVEVENSTPLMWAAQCGYNACLKLLLDTPGIDVNKEVNGKTPLMMAAVHAQTGATRLLLSADGIDVNHQRHVDMINHCDPKCVEMWLDAPGFNLPIDDLIHKLMRHASLEWVNMDLVKKLVKRPGSKVASYTVKHVYDFYQADYYLAREIMQVLMEAEHVETDGISPLMLACMLGDEEKIKKLLADQTVEVDIEDVLYTGQIPIIKLLLESPKCKLTSGHVCYIIGMGNQELISLLPDNPPQAQAVNESFMLHGAARSGKVDSLNAILAVPGVDVNKLTDGYNTSALMEAAESGYDDCVAALLKVEGINATYEKPRYGNNAFTMAVERGHAECAKLLMAIPGFDVNHRRVLATAAERGYAECVELLLNAPGINVNAGKPLAKALQNEHWEIVKLLMAHPAVNKDACPPLMMSIVSGDVQELQKQLDSQKEQINKKGINNRTPLEWAVHLKQLEATKILLAVPGCEYDATQLLTMAIQNRDVEMMKLIMAQPDVKIEPVNIYSQRLVDLAMASGSSEVLKLVMTIPGVDTAGLSPLQHAIAMDDAAKMKELMKSRKQSVNQSDTGEEWKPLAYAAYMGSEECVKALLTVRGIKVNERGYSTGVHYHSLSTALYCSAIGGHANVMKLLLGMKGIDVNADAPLTAAAHCSSVECVKLLLAAPGIEVNKCGLFGGGPALDYPKNPEIRKMLMEAGAR